MQSKFWEGKEVLVTGGASFIGSHLVDKLSNLGASLTVIDNLTSGDLNNLSESSGVKFFKADLETDDFSDLKRFFKDKEFVFHLAAVHGGRGYIDTHPADVASNFSIDSRTFKLAFTSDVRSIVYSSSACVYPPRLQSAYGSSYMLKETDSDITDLEMPLSADIEYGWEKIMAEIMLQSYFKQYGFKSASMRFVTAYGPRENETHAIIALIYKALSKMDPFEIWGTGKQDRDFTYVEDIVSGCIAAAENVKGCEHFNLGTGKRYTIDEVAKIVFDIVGWEPKEIYHDINKPTGVVSRALDISYTKEKLGWEPRYELQAGLYKTIEWYIKTHPKTKKVNNRLLMERT